MQQIQQHKNAINQQNAQNAFGLTASAQNFLWQELRDEADFNFRRWDNDEARKDFNIHSFR